MDKAYLFLKNVFEVAQGQKIKFGELRLISCGDEHLDKELYNNIQILRKGRSLYLKHLFHPKSYEICETNQYSFILLHFIKKTNT